MYHARQNACSLSLRLFPFSFSSTEATVVGKSTMETEVKAETKRRDFVSKAKMRLPPQTKTKVV